MDLNRIALFACACLSVCGVGILVLGVVVVRFGFSVVTDLVGGVLGGGGGNKDKNDSLSRRYGGTGFAAQTTVAVPQISSFEEALARQQQARTPTPLSPQAAPTYPPQQFGGQSVGQLMNPQQGYPQQGYPQQPYPQQFPQIGFTQTNPGVGSQTIQPGMPPQPNLGYGLPPTQPFPQPQLGNSPRNNQRPSLTPGVPYSPLPFPRSGGSTPSPFAAAEDPFGRDRANNRRAEDDRFEIYDDGDDVGGGLDIF